MKTLTSWLLAITLIIIQGCSSDDAVDPESLLPPITTTGKNTFGAIIDGKFFRPRDGTGTFAGPDPGLSVRRTEEKNFEIEINDYKSSRTANMLIHLEQFYVTGSGNYELNASNGQRGIDGTDNSYIHCRIWNDKLSNYASYRSFESSGDVVVSMIDTLSNRKRIFSGIFESQLVNLNDPNDTIVLKLGRFDIETQSLPNNRFN